MEISDLVQDIDHALRAKGTGSRQGHRPSAQDDYGVYKPDFKQVFRTVKKKVSGESGDFIYDVALSLIALNITECRHMGYELISTHKEARNNLTIARIEALAEGLDNWACVDTFCCGIVGRAWREGRIDDATIRGWSRSDDQWRRRSAVVATVGLNLKSRGGTGDVRRTFMICKPLLADESVMVQKAISWAIRELVPWDRDAVEAFLSENQDQTSARVKREVRRKLDTGKKI